MNTTIRSLTKSIAGVSAAMLLVACAADAPPAAERLNAPSTPLALGAPGRAAPELGVCDKLAPPAGSTFAYHVYARGVQIYRWDGQAWAPVGPSAELFADAAGRALVGTHFGGPRWQSLSGSTVRGSVIDRCVYDANAIPWLSLAGVPESGPGVFAHTTFIQRVNTVGGKAPATPGSLDQIEEVPYAAEYYFYRTP
jgi:Protein of unknown function (DUF3455)